MTSIDMVKHCNSLLQNIEYAIGIHDQFVDDNMLIISGLSEQNEKAICSKLSKWFHSDSSTHLRFRIKNMPYIQIRINRNHIELKGGQLYLTSEKAFSFDLVGRLPGQINASTKHICHFMLEGLDDCINSALDLFKKEKLAHKNKVYLPTLEEYLPSHTETLKLKNSHGYKRSENIIRRIFPSLLQKRIDLIDKEDLLSIFNSFLLDRSQAEINRGEPRFSIAESTLKEHFGAIRSCIRAASKKYKFSLNESLYDEVFYFNASPEIDRYLSQEQTERIYDCLKLRDHERKSNSCIFKDYLSPLVALILNTGVRPKYALNISWSDVDFVNKQISIKSIAGNRKIAKTEWIDLSSEMVLLLQEWRNHPVHAANGGGWLFPSPAIKMKRLVSYKSAFTSFRKKYALEFFVLYDLRHTFATNVTSFYGNIYVTQKLLHHADLASTKRYARVLSKDRKEATVSTANASPQYHLENDYGKPNV